MRWSKLESAGPSVRAMIRLLRPPGLGEHVCKTTALYNGEVLLVYFNPTTHQPQAWVVLPDPSISVSASVSAS